MKLQDTDKIVYDAVVVNWRAAIAPLTLKLLTEKLEIPKYKTEIMSVKVLEDGYLCWMAFKKRIFNHRVLPRQYQR